MDSLSEFWDGNDGAIPNWVGRCGLFCCIGLHKAKNFKMVRSNGKLREHSMVISYILFGCSYLSEMNELPFAIWKWLNFKIENEQHLGQ